MVLAKILKNKGNYSVEVYGVNISGGTNSRLTDDGKTFQDNFYHHLPIPTHYQKSPEVFVDMGVDQFEVYSSDPKYLYNFNYEPTYNEPAGTFYSTKKIADQEALDWGWERYEQTSVPFRHLYPATRNDSDFVPANPKPLSNRKEAQVIHANIESSSLFTVILPPKWNESATEGTYPILVNSSYDSNDSLLAQSGQFMGNVIAESSKSGKRGAIGLIWNGAGTLASLTTNSEARDDFAKIIDTLVTKYKANRNWIVMYGHSRGAFATLHMASNPDKNSYRIVMASASEPATTYGEYSKLASTTYPGILSALRHGTGYKNAWRDDFIISSSVRPELNGKTSREALCYILTGTTDSAVADANHSLTSESYLSSLKANGTQVFLRVSANDIWTPYHQQVNYAYQLLLKEVPIETVATYRSGHSYSFETAFSKEVLFLEKAKQAIDKLVDPTFNLNSSPPAFITDKKITYYKLNRSSSLFEEFTLSDGMLPFIADLPYVVYGGTTVPLVFSGNADTKYKLYGDGELITEGTISAQGNDIFDYVVPAGGVATTFTYTLEIQKPGKEWIIIPNTNTPNNSTAVVHYIPEMPATWEQVELKMNERGVISAYPGTTWGLSEY